MRASQGCVGCGGAFCLPLLGITYLLVTLAEWIFSRCPPLAGFGVSGEAGIGVLLLGRRPQPPRFRRDNPKDFAFAPTRQVAPDREMIDGPTKT